MKQQNNEISGERRGRGSGKGGVKETDPRNEKGSKGYDRKIKCGDEGARRGSKGRKRWKN